jgi:hypothetical protein
MSPSTARRRPLLRVETLEDRTAPAIDTTITAATFLDTVKTLGPTTVVMADFNGDGRLDLAIAHKATRDVTVLLDTGNGTFSNEQVYSVGGSGPDALLFGDFNGRGHLDLVSVALDDNEVFYLSGNGDGTFRGPERVNREERESPASALLITGNDEELFADEGSNTPNRTRNDPVDDVGQPNRVETSRSGSVMQSAASGGSRSADQQGDGHADEGQAWGEMTTSFGTAFSLPGSEGLRQPLPDVFVLNGPGFRTELGVVAEGNEPPGPPKEAGPGDDVESMRRSQLPSLEKGPTASEANHIDEAAVPESPGGASVLERARPPGSDVYEADHPDDSSDRSGLADLLAAAATIGVLANDLTIEVSKSRKIRSQ